jgi:peptidylprolyl isomerase
MYDVRNLRFACAIVALLAAGGTYDSVAWADSAPSALVGKAGAVELSDADVRRLVAGIPDRNRAPLLGDGGSLEQLVRGELVRRLVVIDAKARGFDRDAAVVAEMDRLRDEVIARLWLAREAKLPADYPSDDELRRAYDAARDRAGKAAEYRLAQIFIAIPDGAPPDKLAAALRKAVDVQAKLPGADFASLARTYSEQPESAAKGGDIGVHPESSLLPEIRATLATMKVGEVAGPVRTAQGIHFIRLTEKRPVAAAPLSEVHDALVRALRQQRAAEIEQRYLAELAARSPPTINEVELAKLKEQLR